MLEKYFFIFQLIEVRVLLLLPHWNDDSDTLVSFAHYEMYNDVLGMSKQSSKKFPYT